MTDVTPLPDTPCLIVDLNVVAENIRRFQTLATAAGLKARPHIKTHKLPQIARMQIEAGAIGLTCQKIGEAEVMADAGFDDILITYNILGESKLARLVALAGRCRLSVTCDSLTVAQGLSAAFAARGASLDVLVECDTGAGRCGVQDPAAAAALARHIADLPGLRFAGLMTYPPMNAPEPVANWLAKAVEAVAAQGLTCDVISTGGTPNLGDLTSFAQATEHRAGTYVYNDKSLIARGACSVADCAGLVHATVVSRPTPGRAILDSGSKTLSSDQLGLAGYGLIREAPDAMIAALSEEHAIVELGDSGWHPRVGDRVIIVPNHICVVTNLFDTLYLRHADGSYEEVAIPARGKLR
ncbi:D-TA family PLP-dependent enzyme [Phaeovulum sp. W22_SRMD_FR3]|uniref:D-TA family PLP-dependent enzyme n=1 Tax=Phaeovulum sp. W22_SRMD_FR3 TaxID=3240274 RepID=UPI003F96EA5B